MMRNRLMCNLNVSNEKTMNELNFFATVNFGSSLPADRRKCGDRARNLTFFKFLNQFHFEKI